MSKDLERLLKHKFLITRKELAIVHTMLSVRDSSRNTQDYLKQVVAKLLRIFDTQLAFALEYYQKTEDLEVKATNAKGVLKQNEYEIVRKIAKDCLDRSVPVVINKTKPCSVLNKLQIINFMAVPILSHS